MYPLSINLGTKPQSLPGSICIEMSGSGMRSRIQSHRAGHYAHVAHMNLFENESPMFRIPAKICFLKLSPEEAEPPGLRDKKINASDQAEESDICSKLIEQVKLDMRLSDGEDKSRPKSSTISCSSAKERGKSKGRREGNKNKTRNDDDEDGEWAKAKGKVEEFLDFPGVMAAMAYRSQVKSNGSSQISSRNGGGLSSPDPIPNTRHNAIFLRDHENATEAVLRNPQYQKSKQPPAVDSYQSATKSQDRGTKMLETHDGHVDNIEAESDTGNER
ncbi:uncharacterized protein LOC130332584 isoform X3 [Hyla sarda]|uniref:uncharacterized protein LOC130332584 isoform X3 n=2 Tax=Hyla sarda TaxID=327740 RepID=UPI0024C376E4|nr:uncharacterized protein LOC130332584 isoform X3 [Hyla sarda]